MRSPPRFALPVLLLAALLPAARAASCPYTSSLRMCAVPAHSSTVTDSTYAFTAELLAGGYGSCPSSGSAQVTVGVASASGQWHNDFSTGPCNGTPPLAGALSVSVTAAVGASFPVTLAVTTAPPVYGGHAYTYGRLVFTGLPAGYAVLSCSGYGTDGATRVTPGSRGRLKSIYR
jgi:hypothetical protein